MKSVPHFFPGKNNQIEEFTSQRHVPLEAALGHRETMYPEYLLKMQEMQRAEAKKVTGKRPATPQTGFFGKWNLSIAKSTFHSDLTNFNLSGADGSAPQWRTMLFEQTGDSFKHTTDTQLVTNATNFIRIEYTAKLDGQDYKVDTSSTMDAVSFRRIDANTWERTAKDRGKAVEKSIYTLAPGGQELTVKSDGTGQGWSITTWKCSSGCRNDETRHDGFRRARFYLRAARSTGSSDLELSRRPGSKSSPFAGMCSCWRATARTSHCKWNPRRARKASTAFTARIPACW